MITTHKPAQTVSDSRWLRWSLTTIALLLAVIALELSVLIGPIQPRVQAQIPDSGAQLMTLINGQTQTNQTLEQILNHLRTGEIKVTLSGTDKQSRDIPASSPRAGKPAPGKKPAPRTR